MVLSISDGESQRRGSLGTGAVREGFLEDGIWMGGGEGKGTDEGME